MTKIIRHKKSSLKIHVSLFYAKCTLTVSYHFYYIFFFLIHFQTVDKQEALNAYETVNSFSVTLLTYYILKLTVIY